MFVDSHCHLSSEDIFPNLPEVMLRAKEACVKVVLNAGSLFDELPKQLSICRQYDNVYTITGVHPHDAKNYATIKSEDVLKNTLHKEVIGIGECGLDYFYDFSPKDVQIAIFKEMIIAAQESGLPIVVHSRDAEQDTIEILEAAYKKKPFKGVLHCYSSNWELAEAALKIGFYISASGMITFKNADLLRQSFTKVPLNRLLIETDAPYLAPMPFRGRTNEPSYVVKTAQCLAEVKGVGLEELAIITSENFFALFEKAKQTEGKVL